MTHPRPYLSWSQYNLWKRSPKKYVQCYVYGEEFRTEAMRLGLDLAEALEKGTASDDPRIEQVRLLIPEYPLPEHWIKAQINGTKIIGRFDGFDEKGLRIGEVKSGLSIWTQRDVDQSGQLTMYALLVYLVHGKLPGDIKLFWAQTEHSREGIRLKGTLETFETKRTMEDIMSLAVDLVKVWKEIGEVCEVEYKSMGMI